jgi:hypothetical protein
MDQEIAAKVKAEYTGTRELNWATHPKLPDWIIFQVPTRAELRMYFSKQGENIANAQQFILDACVIWPAKADLAASIDAHPGLASTWVGEIIEAAGISSGAQQGKL